VAPTAPRYKSPAQISDNTPSTGIPMIMLTQSGGGDSNHLADSTDFTGYIRPQATAADFSPSPAWLLAYSAGFVAQSPLLV